MTKTPTTSYREWLATPAILILKIFCPLVLFFWVGLPLIFKFLMAPETVTLLKIPAQAFYFLLNPPPLIFFIPVSLALLLGLFLTQRMRITVKNQTLTILRGNQQFGWTIVKLTDIASCEIVPFHPPNGLSSFFSDPVINEVKIITVPGVKAGGIKISYKEPDLGLTSPFSSNTSPSSEQETDLSHILFPTRNPDKLYAILSDHIAPADQAVS